MISPFQPYQASRKRKTTTRRDATMHNGDTPESTRAGNNKTAPQRNDAKRLKLGNTQVC